MGPEFYQTLKELTPKIPNLFYKIDKGGKLISYSYEVSIMDIKLDKGCPLSLILVNIAAWSLSYNKREENKRIKIGKAVKVSLIADDLILCVGNPMTPA